MAVVASSSIMSTDLTVSRVLSALLARMLNLIILAGKSTANQDSTWHALERSVVLRRLSTESSGLSDEEASHRLEPYVLNRLPQRPIEAP